MRRKIVFITALLVLTGCASKTTTDQWKQYARGAYLQGVADGKTAVTCQPVVIQGQAGQVVYGPVVPHGQVVPYGQQITTAVVGVVPGSIAYCNQAKADAAAISEVAKQTDYDLTNNTKERQQTLMRYIELGGKAAQ